MNGPNRLFRAKAGSLLIGLTVVALTSYWSSHHQPDPMLLISPGLTFRSETIAPDTYERQTWTIRNNSSIPLKLRTHFTSGRCGFSLWLGQDQVVLPGASLDLSLSCPGSRRESSAFSGLAEVWTNDLEQPKLRFKILGRTGNIH